jgi:hypothetical protein
VKNSIWIIGILVLTFVGDRVTSLLLNKVKNGSQFRYSRIYNQSTKGIDILLVGNSRGLTFFQPEIENLTHKSTLNIAYNGMPMNLSASIIRDQVELNGAPKLALIDITMCDRVNKSLISGFKTYIGDSKNNLSQLIKENDLTTFNACKLSNLYQFNSEIFQRALYYRNKTDKDWLLDRVISPTMVANAKTMKPFQLDTISTQVEELKKVIGMLESKGTTVRLVVGPYFPTFQLVGLEKFISSVENITGKKVSNYSNILTQDDEFGDYQHPNIKGSKLYMKKLFDDGLFQ